MQKKKQNIIALVYDFDGTLTPKAMQEYTVLPNLGIKEAKAFWKKAEEESKKKKAEKDLVWMRKIIEKAAERKKRIPRKYFINQGKHIKFFPGVKTFFSKINKYVERISHGKMEVRHYIVSSGLKEILDGISIRKEFHNVFGSEYHYDYLGRPSFPKVLITDTIKTQYMFRINKGKENVGESINTYMEESKRPISFKNIIYIGDGLTDVPAMNVTKKSGGYAIAVYKRKSHNGIKTCRDLLKAHRVDFIAQADYRETSLLFKYAKHILDTIVIRELEFNKLENK